MKKTTALIISVLFCLALAVLVSVQYSQDKDAGIYQRIWHHEMAADANPSVGITKIPEDGMVDETFVTHLPLVIIDTFGQEIKNTKIKDPESSSYIYMEGVDPYTDIRISILDSAEHLNTPGTSPILESQGRIKVRGNWSSDPNFGKLQYMLKLKTDDGESAPASILGMEASDTWILNGTMIDSSHMRNYMALNTAGELDPFTPDIRFCEILLKRDDGYEYMGLYGIYEKIEHGVGRVDIPSVPDPITIESYSYIVQRDRSDPASLSMSVYATEHQRSDNWITLEYPKAEKVTDEYWQYIQDDIREVENILYYESDERLQEYQKVLDVDSFVDYFIINEFFSNYDAGWNSTFLYKNAKGKIAIGPVWDFDGAMDNYQEELLNHDAFSFLQSPWYDALLKDQRFVDKILARYHALRQGILSDETITRKLKEASAFLSYPAMRDNSRWANKSYFFLGVLEEEDTQLPIMRYRATPERESQRVLDAIILHAEYMDKEMGSHLIPRIEHKLPASSAGGWLLIITFFVSVVLVQRVRRGQ